MVSNLTALELNAMILDVVSFSKLTRLSHLNIELIVACFETRDVHPMQRTEQQFDDNQYVDIQTSWNQIDIRYPSTSAMITQSSGLPSSMFGSQMLAKSDTWKVDDDDDNDDDDDDKDSNDDDDTIAMMMMLTIAIAMIMMVVTTMVMMTESQPFTGSPSNFFLHIV